MLYMTLRMNALLISHIRRLLSLLPSIKILLCSRVIASDRLLLGKRGGLRKMLASLCHVLVSERAS